MKKSKTIRILRKLDSKELKGLHDYISSPFFNKNKKCIDLLNLIMPYAPTFSSDDLDDPAFTSSIYKNKGSMKTLMKIFLRLIEGFLVQQKLMRKEGLKQHLLLEELRRIGEDKYFKVIYDKSIDNITHERGSRDKYYEAYLLEVSMLRMNYEARETPTTLYQQINKATNALDKFTMSSHLWLDNTALILIKEAEIPKTLKPLTEMTTTNSLLYSEQALRPRLNGEPLIQIHCQLRRLYENDTEENFIQLFHLLKQYHDKIGKEDYNYFYKYLVNFSIQKILKDEENYLNLVLDIYLFAMDIGAFIEEEYLEPSRMRNIIVLCCRLDKMNLATAILDKYVDSVNPLYKHATQYYCKGHILYYEKNYESAIHSFNKCIDLKSVFMLYAQSEIYKIYYTIREHWAFEVPVQSFIVKLTRHKHKYSKNMINGYLNFFRTLKQIYKKREYSDYNKSIEEIIFKLNSFEHISNKKWLLEKINEL